jgi:hypothetical protein
LPAYSVKYLLIPGSPLQAQMNMDEHQKRYFGKPCFRTACQTGDKVNVY